MFERLIRIDEFGQIFVGNTIAQRKVHCFPGGNYEFTDMSPAFRAKPYWRAQDHAVGTSDCLQTSVVAAAYPRHDRTIIETDDELGAQSHVPAYAAHETNEMGARRACRHKIGHDGDARGGL
ncbi:MAG: hypothetical protein ACREV8_15375, partial [Gammaproteobacteria bacterium]